MVIHVFFLFSEESGTIIPVYKGEVSTGLDVGSRSGGYAVRGTISTLILRVVFFP